MKRRILFALALVLVASTIMFGTSACSSKASTASEEDAPAIAMTVHVKDGEFDPRDIDIEAGGTVMWINDDVASHDLHFLAPNKLYSGVVKPGKAWIHTFAAAGTYDYYCDFHNTMKGVVVVRPAP
ncbi:MAG: cupredoxin domain-containing protein [Actinomycetota bacterium]